MNRPFACHRDNNGDGNCHLHPQGCPSEFNTYQNGALRTLAEVSKTSRGAMLTTAALGLAGESGEFADIIKKIYYHGHSFDEETEAKMVKELGDILYYVAIGAAALNKGLEEIAILNHEKRVKRYPNGFSTERSLNKTDG